MTRHTAQAVLSVDGPDQLSFAGAQLFVRSQAQFVDWMRIAIKRSEPSYVLTLNVDQALRVAEDGEFGVAYQRADVRTVDGMPIIALARLMGARTTHRNTGADLLPATAEAAAMNGWRVVIAGGQSDTARAAAERLSARFQGASVAALPFPQLSDVKDASSHEVIDGLFELKPDVVFLCLGSPKQELWYQHWKHILPAAVYVGAGAAVDFAAARRRRAPSWLQQAGGEWLWRLAQEPKRLAFRYLVRGPQFLKLVTASIWRHRRKWLR